MDGAQHSSSGAVEQQFWPSAQSPLVVVRGEIPTIKPSFGYRLGLLIVACAMILLPLIYVALVALFGFAVYYHAAHHYTIISLGSSGRITVVMTVVYAAPIVAGIIMMVFLVKPLFARSPQHGLSRSLSHEEAPLLFALLGQLCRAMNAPIPSRIDVDCEVNAAASFRGGLASLWGRDLKLNIGLPLVAGLTLQQFAGVLAHELGHFTQGAAMRVTYLVRSINFWFARVVYERDELDWWLNVESEAGHPYASFALYLARFGVWCSRGVLWILMTIGHALSSFMLRQMEHDADAYERQLAGSAAFIDTVRALQRLNLAAAGSFRSLKKMWQRDHRLYDSVPEFIACQASQIPADAQGQLYEEYLRRKTGCFDTHPSDQERIARAQATNNPGVYQQTAPAACLFQNFPELCRDLSLHLYAGLIGDEPKESHLVPIARVSTDLEHDYDADRSAVNAFFLGVATSLRPIRLPDARTFRDFATLERDLKSARERMIVLQPPALEALAGFKEADAASLLASQAAALIETGMAINPGDFNLPDSNLESVSSVLKQTQVQSEKYALALKPFEDAALARLGSALQLIRSIQTARHLQDSDHLHDEAKDLRWTVNGLVRVFDVVLQLRRDTAVLEHLRAYSADSTVAQLSELTDGMRSRIKKLQDNTAGLPYPFPHPAGRTSVSDYAKCKDFHPDPTEMLLREGNAHVQNLIALYYRIVARLVVIAQEVEGALAKNDSATPAT